VAEKIKFGYSMALERECKERFRKEKSGVTVTGINYCNVELDTVFSYRAFNAKTIASYARACMTVRTKGYLMPSNFGRRLMVHASSYGSATTRLKWGTKGLVDHRLHRGTLCVVIGFIHGYLSVTRRRID